jgi:hypothetical protein
MYNFLQSISAFINKRSLLISFLIIISAFLFMYLPFYFYTPIIAMGYDAFDYFFCVEQMNNGKLPAFDFLPPGFPVFVWLIGFLSKKIITVIIVQNIIFILSCFLFLYALNKYMKLGVGLIFISLSLAIFIMDPFSVMLCTALWTDTIYISSLIIVSSLLIVAVFSKNATAWIVFSISLIFPAVIRSNGVYIYFIPIALLIFMIVNKYEKKFYRYLLIPFLSLNLAWAIFNWQAYGLFFVSNPIRILNGIVHHLPSNWFPEYPKNYPAYMIGDKDAKAEGAEIKVYDVSYNSTFYLYHKAFTDNKSPFYYSQISARYFEDIGYYKYKNSKYSEYYRNDNQKYNLQEYKVFNGAYPISRSLKKLILKEYYREDEYQYAREWFEDRENTMYSFFDPYGTSITAKMSVKEVYNNSYNFWFFLTYILHLLYEKIFWNVLWYIGYYLIFIFILHRLILTKFRDKDMFVFFIIFLVHFMSISILPFFHRVQDRYAHVTEFVIYLMPFLLAAYLIEKKNKRTKKDFVKLKG